MPGQRASYDEIILEISERIRTGESVEDVIRFMRESGLDIMDSITALKDAKLFGTSDAKVAVFKSAAWADEIGSHSAFHDALLKELDREGLTDLDRSSG